MKRTLGDNHGRNLVDFSDVNAANQSVPAVVNALYIHANKAGRGGAVMGAEITDRFTANL